MQRKTQSNHTVNMAHQQKSILKITPPINFQFIERNQQKAYMTAARLVENLGYSKITSQPLKLISTQEHIKYLQQLTPSKVSHNRMVTFNIKEENDSINNDNNKILMETHLIFSVLNCTSFKESYLRSTVSNTTL